MEDKKIFELNDEALDAVAGGTDSEAEGEWKDCICETCGQRTPHLCYPTGRIGFEWYATCSICKTESIKLTRTVF